MRLQLLLAHLSHLLPARPTEVLVIGCGAGITAGALATGPGVDHVTIAEIEPLVPKVAAQFFGDFNHHVMQNPRVSVRIDDGRHVLATSTNMFDVITTDLTDPWVKGVASLFTEEFFELAKRRLRPGGIVTQFVQLYQSSPAAVKSEIATFVKVFPNAAIWGNPQGGEGYDLVLVGQADPIRIDIDALQYRLDQPSYRAGAGVTPDCRHWLGDRPACAVCGVGIRSVALAPRRVNQSRSRSSAAVPCGTGTRPRREPWNL